MPCLRRLGRVGREQIDCDCEKARAPSHFYPFCRHDRSDSRNTTIAKESGPGSNRLMRQQALGARLDQFEWQRARPVGFTRDLHDFFSPFACESCSFAL